MIPRRALTLPALIALVATLAILAPTASAQGGRTLEFEVYLHELAAGGFHVVPEQINAEKGDVLRMTVRNEGTVRDNAKHDLLVCGDGPTPGMSCNDKWGFTALLENNQTAVLTATMQKAGTFVYYCTVPGHAQAGMRGKLVVAGGDEKATPAGAVAGTLAALAAVALVGRRRP